MNAKATLFTNIDNVSIGNVHTSSHALLLDHHQGPSGHRYWRLRGFLYNSVTPTAEIELESPEYVTNPADGFGRSYLWSFKGRNQRLIEVGMVLTFNDEPLNVTEFEGTPTLDYEKIWTTMNRRIVAYWDAPYFLESRQVSIHDARRNVHIERP